MGESTKCTKWWIAASLVLALSVAMTGCQRSESSVPDSRNLTSSSFDMANIRGLVFIRNGQVFLVKDNDPIAIARAADARNPSYDRSRTTVTYLSESSVFAVSLQNLEVSALRAEPLLEHALLDAQRDRLWLSVVGDTGNAISRLDSGSDTLMRLPMNFAPSGDFDVDFGSERIIATDVNQNPARLYMAGTDNRTTEIFSAATLFAPSFSGDGSRICVTGTDETGVPRLWVFDASGAGAIQVEIGQTHPADPAWSADGARIAYRDVRGGNVWIASLDGGEPIDTGITADEGGLAW